MPFLLLSGAPQCVFVWLFKCHDALALIYIGWWVESYVELHRKTKK